MSAEPVTPHPTQLESVDLPPAMRAALEQLNKLAVAELHAHRAGSFTIHQDIVRLVRLTGTALAWMSDEAVHHPPSPLTAQLLDQLATAACALRDAYQARLAKAKERKAP